MLLSQQFLLHLVRYRTNFPGALRQHCTLMTWSYGTKSNMTAQQTTGFNKPLTNESLSTRTNPPQHFTLSPKKQASPIKIGTQTLKEEDEATYLGVTCDKMLTWKSHTLHTEAHKKLTIMRKLAGTTWAANEQILKTVYEGSVRPVLKYSSTAWSTTAKTNQQSLDNIQNQALRITAGAMKSITFMEETTAIKPLQQRRQAKVLLHAEKYKCLPDHPMKERVEGRTKNRIKKSSYIH